jgi:hypothetical protein
MTEKRDDESFNDFWYSYLADHGQPGTRTLHFIGTAIGLGSVLAAIITLKPVVALIGIGVAYSFAWTGHLLIEKNIPSMTRHPLWALRSDLLMFALWVAGRLKPELEKAGLEPGVPASSQRLRTRRETP